MTSEKKRLPNLRERLAWSPGSLSEGSRAMWNTNLPVL